MRALAALSFALWSVSCGGSKPPAGPQRAAVVSLMPAFWEVIDAAENDAAETRAARFRQEVIAPHAALYGPVIAVEPDQDFGEYLAQLEPLLPTMRELEPRMSTAIVAGLDSLRALLGEPGPMTVYVAPSLFTTNGQVRVVDGAPVVIFGVDVQAYAELELLPAASRYDLRAYVAHELFHAHHYGVNAELRGLANALFDPANPAPIHVNLWIEGLATCVSMSVDGDGTPERALMSERLPRELPPVLGQVARELGTKLDSRSVADTRDFFWLDGARTDIPPRSAYAVGALVAEDVLARRGLAAALRLSGTELRGEVGRSLATIAERDGELDWSAVCGAGTLRP
jgi:hypothetical protein